jgi:hypothetical protein
MGMWKWSVRIGGSLVALTALVGVLHLPMARPLLGLLSAFCPVGNASPARIEEARSVALRSLRGEGIAPARPALGFVLDRTTYDDVRAWARSRRIACESSREDTLLVCSDIPADALGAFSDSRVDELAFGFRVRDKRLVNLTTLTTGLAPAAAAVSFDAIAGRLASQLGDAPLSKMPGAGWDGRGPAIVRYKFADYIANLTAMSLPDRGVVLKEHYLYAADAASASAPKRSN